MLTLALLAATLVGSADSLYYRATVRADSAVFEFPVQYDTAWAVGKRALPAHTAEYEWTISTVVGDTVFSFGYVLYNDSYRGTRVKFVDARTKLGEQRLLANGFADPSVSVDVAFQASRVVIRLKDAAAIRRVFALKPVYVQFSSRFAGGLRETMDVPVDYGQKVVADVLVPVPVSQPDEPPDSTYMRLITEFPALAMFSADIESRGRLSSMHTEIRNLTLQGCVLAFEVWSHVMPEGTSLGVPSFRRNTVAIPLNALDTRSFNARPYHPPTGYRYTPQPWVLHIAVKRDTKVRIMVGDVDSRYRAGASTIEIDVRDHEAGALLQAWLTDGANRCNSWKTGPLKPIR